MSNISMDWAEPVRGSSSVKMRGLCAIALAGTLALSACSDSDSDSDPSASTSDAATATSTDDAVAAEDSAAGTAGLGDASEEDATSDEVGAAAGGDDESDADAEEDADEEAQAESGGSAAEDPEANESGSAADDEQEEFSYPDEPEPAPEVARTLCNLDSDYFKNLRGTSASGEAVVDDSLRTSILSLGDNLSLWIDLQRSFPEVEDDVARAQTIYDSWDEALLLSDNGDSAAAAEAMAAAEAEIAQLPSSGPDAVGCSS